MQRLGDQTTHAGPSTGSSRQNAHRTAGVGGLLVIVALALIVRVVHVIAIADIGFFEQPVSDARIYVDRAHKIAAGDWLGRADFVHAPLYAYVLGAVYASIGDGPWAVRIVQCVLGSLSCMFVALAGAQWFGRRAGIIAGCMSALYPPAIFFDGLIQKTSLALLLACVLVWLMSWPASRRSLLRAGLIGATLGLLALTRQNALAMAPLLVVWAWQSANGGAARQRAARCATIVAVLAVTLLPWALRNRAVTGEFVLTTPNLGQNFAMGNHPSATGTYLPQRRGSASAETEQAEWTRAAESALGRSLSPKQVSDFYLRSALAFIREQPAAWAALMFKKWRMVWGAYESYDTEDYYLYQRHSPMLFALDRVWHFGVLAPLAAMGMVFTLRRWRELWVLYGWLLITALAVAAFVVFGRYRMPLVPVLVLFAAACLTESIERWRTDRFRSVLPALTVGALAALVCNWPVYHARRPDATSYVNHGTALAAAGRFEADLAELGKALAIEPDHVDAHLGAGNSLVQLGRYDDAIEHYRAALRGDQHYAGAYRGLGNAMLGQGRLADAREHFVRARRLDPNDARAISGLATITARSGDFEQAVPLFEQALTIDPDLPEALENLGNTYFALGLLDDAARCYRAVLDQHPDFGNTWFNLGNLEMARGRPANAVRCFERCLKYQPDNEAAREALDTAHKAADQSASN